MLRVRPGEPAIFVAGEPGYLRPGEPGYLRPAVRSGPEVPGVGHAEAIHRPASVEYEKVVVAVVVTVAIVCLLYTSPSPRD